MLLAPQKCENKGRTVTAPECGLMSEICEDTVTSVEQKRYMYNFNTRIITRLGLLFSRM